MALKEAQPCPWCKKLPTLSNVYTNRYKIFCINQHCPIQPSTKEYQSIMEAFKAWTY